MKILDADDFASFSPIFRGRKGRWLAESLMRFLAIDKVNRVYDNSGNYSGAGFASRLLADLGIDYAIGNAERLKLLPNGAFITIANHPYGGLDGIILVDLMAGIRDDYKLMVNKILSLVKTMQCNFVTVTPVEDHKTPVTAGSISGIRETINRIKNGHPVGFFPSGAVSDLSLKNMRVSDREWQTNILRLIHAMRVPILPVRFFDGNSPFFYFLGLIYWKIRLLRLPGELFNKQNRNIRIGIGKLISVEEQIQFHHYRDLGRYLRKAVYEMPVPDSFVLRSELDMAMNSI